MARKYGIQRMRKYDFDQIYNKRREMKAGHESKSANEISEADEVMFNGAINYDVLLDAQLAEKYGYYPCYIEDRNLFARKITCESEQEPDESFASDLPRIVIDLPYLTLEKAKKLEMT